MNKHQLAELAEALLACQSISDRPVRDAIIDDLPDFIEDSIRRHASNRADVISLIKTCRRYEGGVQALVEAVELYEGDSLAMRQLLAVWEQIQQAPPTLPELPSEPPDWRDLAQKEPPEEEVPEPPIPLGQLLVGTWQTLTTYPNGMTSAATVQIYANGTFYMQGTSPFSASGQFVMQGWWTVDIYNQLQLQGQQSDGFRYGPFAGFMRFNELEQNRLAGRANTGSQLVWTRIA